MSQYQRGPDPVGVFADRFSQTIVALVAGCILAWLLANAFGVYLPKGPGRTAARQVSDAYDPWDRPVPAATTEKGSK